jgi:hypothetical protein
MGENRIEREADPGPVRCTFAKVEHQMNKHVSSGELLYTQHMYNKKYNSYFNNKEFRNITSTFIVFIVLK